MAAGQVEAARELYVSATQANEKHAAAYVGLGHIHLALEDLEEAEKAFKLALRKDKRHAPASNGLGLVYREKKNGLRRAIRFFRDAVRADRSYAEAQYNMAQTLQRYGSSETLKAYEKAVEMDPAHPDAHFQIGRIQAASRRNEKAERAFRAQIAAAPEHQGARLYLALVLKASGRLDEAVGTLEEVVTSPGEHQRRSVLELAGIFQQKRAFGRSAALYESYIADLVEHERSVYRDLRLVAGRSLPEGTSDNGAETADAAFHAFWESRDPAPVTEANERLLEHYRRVAFARENYGKARFPWDDRGETYIRYGDPNHVSRSGDHRVERHPRVVAVKDRLVAQAGEAGVALLRARAEEVQSSMRSHRRDLMTQQERDRRDEVQRDRGQVDTGIASEAILGWPVYPVPAMGKWEYWIYVDPPMEVTYTQRVHEGPYEYADPPQGLGKIAKTWQEMAPEFVIQEVAHRRPSTYRPDFATGPLDFYFSSATFRAPSGQTALEVYYGVPTRHLLSAAQEAGGGVVELVRGLGVYDGSGKPVHRLRSEMPVRIAGAVDTSAGAFVPAVDRVELPPGAYRIRVQVLDETSGKSQVYPQDRVLADYSGDGLKVSEIELAHSIEASDGGPFAKGDVSVLPAASRSFGKAQPVGIYFEVYNLVRDAFGATKYRVSYELRSLERKSVGARVLSGLGRLLGRESGEGTVRIEYEQTGTTTEEQVYLQLDVSESEPGRQLLKVSVTDELSGVTAATSALYRTQE